MHTHTEYVGNTERMQRVGVAGQCLKTGAPFRSAVSEFYMRLKQKHNFSQIYSSLHCGTFVVSLSVVFYFLIICVLFPDQSCFLISCFLFPDHLCSVSLSFVLCFLIFCVVFPDQLCSVF
jgi:hypothetical protein